MAAADNSTGLRLLCIILLPICCLWGLGSYGLLDNNEGLYASIAAGMLHGGNLIIPHLNGVPYLEKPPLLYWLVALSMGLFGQNEFAARLPLALATILLAVAMMRFLSMYHGRRTGTIAALIVATSPVVLVIGRTVYCDMLMTSFLAIGLMAFYRWYAEKNRNWLVFCYAMVGVAVMVKGVVTIMLTGGTILLFLLLENNFKRLVQTFDPLAIAAFLLVAAPWHIAAALQDKNFLWFYFINEHVLRFLGNRQPHDYYHGPIWYYLIRLPIYLFPWSLLWLPFIGQRAQWSEPTPAREALLKRFLWVWFAFSLIFFSFSIAKANYYMVAGLPPLIMLTALYTESALRHRRGWFFWWAGLTGLGTTGLLIAFVPWIGHLRPKDAGAIIDVLDSLSFVRDILPPLALAFAGLLIAWGWRRVPDTALVLMCIPTGVLLPLMLSAAIIGEPMISQKRPVQFLEAHAKAEHFAVYRDFEEISSLAFYTDKPLSIVDSASNDLAYGKKEGSRPDLFPSFAAWLARPADSTRYLMVRRYYLPDLERQLAAQPRPTLCLVKQYPMIDIFKRC